MLFDQSVVASGLVFGCACCLGLFVFVCVSIRCCVWVSLGDGGEGLIVFVFSLFSCVVVNIVCVCA